jgi:RNA polymerase sigma-70 factor (ECF subfamily)
VEEDDDRGHQEGRRVRFVEPVFRPQAGIEDALLDGGVRVLGRAGNRDLLGRRRRDRVPARGIERAATASSRADLRVFIMRESSAGPYAGGGIPYRDSRNEVKTGKSPALRTPNGMETRRDVVLSYMANPGREALSEILQASQDRIYGICYQILGHPQDAEDAAQEVLLKIPGVLQTLRDDLHYRRWLYRVSINAALELKRKKQRRLRHEGNAPGADRRSADEPKDALHQALASLEDDDRDLLVAHYFEKRTLEALARDHACSTTALWKRLERGRERLKDKLQSTAPSVAFEIFERLLESAASPKAPPGLARRVAAKAGRMAGPLRALFVLGGAAAFLAVVTVVGASLRSRTERTDGPSRNVRPAAAARVEPAAPEAALARVDASKAAPIVESAKAPAPAKESLSDRLVRYRAWLKEQAERELRLTDAEKLEPLRAALSARIREESDQVRALILADPETFLAFLKAPRAKSACSFSWRSSVPWSSPRTRSAVV